MQSRKQVEGGSFQLLHPLVYRSTISTAHDGGMNLNLRKTRPDKQGSKVLEWVAALLAIVVCLVMVVRIDAARQGSPREATAKRDDPARILKDMELHD